MVVRVDQGAQCPEGEVMTHADERIGELERGRRLAAKTLAKTGKRISEFEATVRAACTQISLKEAEDAEKKGSL